MSTSINAIILSCAVVIGLSAAFISSWLSPKAGSPLQQQVEALPTREEPPKVETVEAVVAKKNLPVYSLVDEADLTTTTVSKTSVPADVISNISDLKNKRLRRTLKEGAYLSSSDVREDINPKVPNGTHQYAVSATFNEAKDFVSPGDKVDIIYTESSSGAKFKSSQKLRDILVLDLDRMSSSMFTVSLAVTEEQGLLLSSYQKHGQIKIVGRDPKSSQP